MQWSELYLTHKLVAWYIDKTNIAHAYNVMCWVKLDNSEYVIDRWFAGEFGVVTVYKNKSEANDSVRKDFIEHKNIIKRSREEVIKTLNLFKNEWFDESKAAGIYK